MVYIRRKAANSFTSLRLLFHSSFTAFLTSCVFLLCFPDIAQEKAEENLKVRGTQLKIGNDIAYANYIEDKIVKEDYSPAAVLGELKAQGREKEFNTTVCVTTLYSYIDKGVFLKLTNKDLPVKKNKKRGYKKVRKQQARAAGNINVSSFLPLPVWNALSRSRPQTHCHCLP